MHILVTGGAGFLGRLLIEKLREEGDAQITAIDVAAAEFDDPRIQGFVGDLAGADWLEKTLESRPPIDQVYHLAAVVSGAAEADFDRGYRANLDGTRNLLESLRRQAARGGPLARLVFTSSVAVFGGRLPPVIQDETVATPQWSYGVQKLLGEYLIGDYTRKGYLDGRAVRLPTISVRPGKPNTALSSFASGIIREPLAGQEAELPVPRDTALWLLSPEGAVAALRHTLTIDPEPFHDGVYGRGLNLPGITVTVAEMLDALHAVGGAAALARVREVPDERVLKVVPHWPARFETARAYALGYPPAPRFTEVVRAYARRYARA